MGKAAGLARSGNLDGAIREYRRIIRDNGDFADAHFALGIVYVQAGEDRKACDSFREYLKLAPNGPYAPTARASVANC